MKWRLLGRILSVAAWLQVEPERSALRSMGRELEDLDAPRRVHEATAERAASSR